MANNEAYLTEMILTIHNEIQSAVDYISEVAAKNSTELGKSSAVMCIENLRVKIPFLIELEQKTSASKKLSGETTIEDLKKNLSYRKGFMIDKGQTGKLAQFSKVKVISKLDLKQEKDGNEEKIFEKGEIEIVFSPVKRD